MGFDFARAWRIAQTVFGVADASRRVFTPASPGAPPEEAPTDLAAGGLVGQLETRLTGVLVSALKQAFDHDAERLAIERAALDEQRRRAEEALRLELVRQAGERALARAWAIGGIALVVWIVSVLFAMRFPAGFAGAGRFTLAAAWAALAGALGCAFAAHAATVRWIAGAEGTRASATDLPSGGASSAAPWLVLAGLVLVAASFLVALG